VNHNNLINQYFSWQNGYGAFTVSESQINPLIKYIENQKNHHKNQSFKEEYIIILNKNNIEYNPNNIWS
jgi:REP-associated tyrosine transposase